MILELYMKNCALVEELRLGIDENLNILTGETGSGKSIIIDALGLCLGEKYDRSFLRKGTEKGVIEAVFHSESSNLKKVLHEHDLDLDEDNLLVITRVIYSDGKSVARVNGRTVKLSILKDIASTITDLGKAIMDNLDKVNETTSHSEYNKAMHEVKRLLLQINNISSSDLGKLHNAQVFSNKKTKKNDDIFYQKKKKSAKKKKNSISFRVNNLTFSNNLYDVCVNLLNQYKKALEGKHEIKIGIRPENIHLDNEFIGKTKSNTFVVNADVVELMGSELLIHSNWNNAEFISKISTGTLVKPHTDVSLVLDIAKLHLFDVNCGDTIQ